MGTSSLYQLSTLFYCIVCLQSVNISQIEKSIHCAQTIIGNTPSADDLNYYHFSLNSTMKEVTLSTCGSSFDTILYIYSFTNNTYSYFDECDDCGDCSQASTHSVWTTYDLHSGDYIVRISGFSSNYGDYILSMSCYSYKTNGTMQVTIHPHKPIQCNHTIHSSLGDSHHKFHKLSLNTSIDQISISSCGSTIDTIAFRIFSYHTHNRTNINSITLYDVCLFCGECLYNSKQSIWNVKNVPAGLYLIEILTDSVGNYTITTGCFSFNSTQKNDSIQWNVILNLTLPKPLSFHIMGYYENRMVILGGIGRYSTHYQDNTNIYYSDWFSTENMITSVSDNAWNILNISGRVIHCYSDCSVQIGELIYLIPYDDYCLGQTSLWIYNISALSFINDYNQNVASYLEDECNKVCVTANSTHLFIIGVYEVVVYDIAMDAYTRFEHGKDVEGVACGYYDHYIYLFGGQDASGQYSFTRVYRYDTHLQASQTMRIFELDLAVDQTDSRSVTTPDYFMLTFGGHCTDADCHFFGSFWDAHTETIFRNIEINPFGGYGSGYVYDAEYNIVIQSGGNYTDTFGYLDLNHISTQIEFKIVNNVIVPGDSIHFNYSVSVPQLSHLFVSDPLVFALDAKELNIYSEIRIFGINQTCFICSINCVRCHYGLFIPVTSSYMMNKSYDIIVSSVSSGVALNPSNTDQIITLEISSCPPGYGVKTDASIMDCTECEFNTFSLIHTQNECIGCGSDIKGITCQGGDNVIVDHNHWIYALHGESQIISFQNMHTNDSIHSVICPPNVCCLDQKGCNYAHNQTRLCTKGRDYESLLCSACAYGLYELFGSNECGQCDHHSNIGLLFIPLIFCGLFVLYIIYFDSAPMDTPSGSMSQIKYKTYVIKDNIIALQTLFFKILLYYYQSIIQILFARGITSYLFQFYHFFNFSNLMMSNSDGSGFCVIPFLKPLSKILSYLIGPSFLLLNFVVIYLAFVMCNSKCGFCRKKTPYFGAAIFRVLLMCIGSVLSTCFQLVTCIQLADSRTVHFYDASKYCYDGYWILSVLCIVSITLTFAAIFYVIWRQSDEERQSPSNIFRKFIKSFANVYWFWEIVLFSRRFVIALFTAIQFVGGGNSNFILTILLCVYGIFHMKHNPFLYSRVNGMESLCMFLLILTFICINFMDVDHVFIAVFVFCSILLPILIFIYHLIQTIVLYCKSRKIEDDLRASDIRVTNMVARMPVDVQNVLMEKIEYDKVHVEMYRPPKIEPDIKTMQNSEDRQ
eukprot:259342_1